MQSFLLVWQGKLLLTLVFHIINLVVFIKFFSPRIIRIKSALEKKYGKEYSQAGNIGSITYGPVLEEITFRFPVYIATFTGYYYTGIALSIAIGTIFGLLHRYETTVYGYDEIPRSWISCARSCFSGSLYGIVAVVSHAIWTSILLHWLWNLHCELTDRFVKYRTFLDKFAGLTETCTD